MRKTAVLLLFILLYDHGSAQYATTGVGAWQTKIWWLDWSGFSITEGASRTFLTNDSLSVTITFSNTTAHEPQPSVMNTWSGAILHLLYDFTDPAILPALYDQQSTLPSAFTMTITATRAGLPTPILLIAADAEASSSQEVNTLQTSGAPWQTIEFYRNSSQTIDPLTGCGSPTVSISNTYGDAPQTGQAPILITASTGLSPLTVAVSLDHGGTTGGMGLAFGILESVDRGDLPASYGTAQHRLLYDFSNSCSFMPPFPAATQIGTLKIGAVPGDADPIQYDNDDSIGVDEEGVSSFPPYDGSGSYSIQAVVGNTTGNTAYLTGWFDYNRNGVLESNEMTTTLIPNNASAATLTWTGLPQYLPTGSASGYGFRFRISSDLQSAQQPTGFAPDGEVEDYFVNSPQLCSMTVTAGPDTSVCSGQPVPLLAKGGTQYTWTADPSLSGTDIPDPIAKPLVSTQYTVTASNPQGCSAGSSVQVSVLPAPDMTISDDTTICLGRSLNLTAGGGVAYAWTPAGAVTGSSASGITVSPVNSTMYYVLITGSNGCQGTDSVLVTIHRVPAFGTLPADPVVCRDDTIRLSAFGGEQYAWSDNSGNSLGSDASIIVRPDEDQSYQVQITDNICQVTQTLAVPVYVRDLPVPEISRSNDIDCTLGQAQLKAAGGVSYLWESIPGISDTTAYDPVVRPFQTTTYFVKVTGGNGCSVKDSITVSVDFAADLSKYPIPSAFTPNNDGNNDCFGLKYWGRITSLEMKIFNRWGQLVFSTSDPGGCWDGAFKGAPQPAGTYVYQVKATTACGTAFRKGTVLLIR
jgi:gliding motility-associated-like protein